MKYIPLIFVLLIILVIILSISCGVIYVKRRAKEISREVFGTSNLSQAAAQMKQEYAATPKSVSAMTSLLLPKIAADFPDFEYDEMKERTNNILIGYLRAITARDSHLLTDGSTELKQQLTDTIEMLSANDKQEHFHEIKIHRTEICQYRKTKGRCIITFQSALECYHYITNSAGQIIQGSKDNKYQTKYNTNLIYIQNRNLVENELDYALAINCPNCGAPLSSLGAKVCDYCDSPIIEINIHAWSFHNIEECR